MAGTKFHVTVVFDGKLDAADVFAGLIAQKYGGDNFQNTLSKEQNMDYNKDKVQKEPCFRLDCAGERL